MAELHQLQPTASAISPSAAAGIEGSSVESSSALEGNASGQSAAEGCANTERIASGDPAAEGSASTERDALAGSIAEGSAAGNIVAGSMATKASVHIPDNGVANTTGAGTDWPAIEHAVAGGGREEKAPPPPVPSKRISGLDGAGSVPAATLTEAVGAAVLAGTAMVEKMAVAEEKTEEEALRASAECIWFAAPLLLAGFYGHHQEQVLPEPPAGTKEDGENDLFG